MGDRDAETYLPILKAPAEEKGNAKILLRLYSDGVNIQSWVWVFTGGNSKA